MLKRFKGLKLYSEDGLSFQLTKEGSKAVFVAMTFLGKEKTRVPLVWSPELHMAARDHVEDTAPKGIISGTGSDGSTPSDRIARYSRIDETWSESTVYGVQNAKEVMEKLIVCDG
jgi:uncharacterized protein YkwD